jgi:hypothetical protein
LKRNRFFLSTGGGGGEAPASQAGSRAAAKQSNNMMGPVISSRDCGSRAAAVPLVVSSKTKAQTHPPTSLVLPFSNPKSQLSLFNIHHKFYHTRRNGVAQSSPKMVTCSASAEKNNSAAKKLRLILDSPGVHQGPACFDALSALLVQRAGFDYCFTSGMYYVSSYLLCPMFFLKTKIGCGFCLIVCFCRIFDIGS